MIDNHTTSPGAVVLPSQRGAAVTVPEVPDSIADIAERLMGEFGDRLDLDVISGIVLDCRDGLAGSPAELVERQARQRLRRSARS